MRMLLLVTASVFWAASVAYAGPPVTNSFAIRNVRVFDGDNTIARTTVIVRDGKVVAMGPDTPIPAGLNVIDGAGETLLPGLIDAHVHVFPGAQQDALRFGVTTELDMFDVQRDFKAWRAQRVSLGKTDQADTWAAGIGATVAGGAPMQNLPPSMNLPTIHDVAGANAFVRARIAEGSDYIKAFLEDLSEYNTTKRLPTLSRAELCAVVKAAHSRGRMVIVHAQQESKAIEAIDCGADGLAHMFPDVIATSADVALVKSHHVFIITTGAVWAGVSGLDLAKTIAADPRVAPFLSAMQKQTLLATEKKPVPAYFPNIVASIGVFQKAGVSMLAGTDAPNIGTAHGVSLHEELQILVRAGLTPEQALHAATAEPAAIFHLGDRGHVAVGDRADLLLVKGDPTTDISATLSIDRIWKNGNTVTRTPPADAPKAKVAS